MFSLALFADYVGKHSKQILNDVVYSLVLAAGETKKLCNTCYISKSFCSFEIGVVF